MNDLVSFNKLNLNPKDNRSGDCVIRAIAYATKETWEDTYRNLAEFGIKQGRILNEKQCYSKYLKKLGWNKQKAIRDQNNKRITINELAKTLPEGVYIVHTKRHLTIIDNGQVVDNWDTRFELSGIYYSLEQQ